MGQTTDYFKQSYRRFNTTKNSRMMPKLPSNRKFEPFKMARWKRLKDIVMTVLSKKNSKEPKKKLSKRKQQCWIKLLPIEIQINILYLADLKTFEIVLAILDTPLPGVVLYVTERKVFRKTKNKQERVLIQDLDKRMSNCMINIIHTRARGMGLLQSSRALCPPSNSSNHIVLKGYNNASWFNPSNQKQCILGNFIKSMSLKTSILIKDSKFIGLKDQILDLSRISFENVKKLYLQKCEAHGTPYDSLEARNQIVLKKCSGFLNSIDYASHSTKSLCLDESAPHHLILKNKVINIPECRISSISDMENVAYNGTYLFLRLIPFDNLRSKLSGIYAARLRYLYLYVRGAFPKVTVFRAPQLQEAEIYYRADIEYDVTFSEFSFLKHVKKLKITGPDECLHKVSFCNLSNLKVCIGTYSTMRPLRLPSVRAMTVKQYRERIPLISAPLLFSFHLYLYTDDFETRTLKDALEGCNGIKKLTIVSCKRSDYDFSEAILSKRLRLKSLELVGVDHSFVHQNHKFPWLSSLKVNYREMRREDVDLQATQLLSRNLSTPTYGMPVLISGPIANILGI